MIKSLRLSAIVPSTDISETKKFLVDVLQFSGKELVVEDSEYAIVSTANTELHIQAVEGEPNQMSLYLLVASVDAVWTTLKDIEGVKKKAPFVQEYGMKEVHVILPHTNTLMFIGEEVG